jgi:Tol biopolymer transport system component
MNADGSNPASVFNSAADDGFVAWSPDGERIAFRSHNDDNWDLYVIDLDSSTLTRLTDNPGDDFDQSWSPDGWHIAFNSDRDGNIEIYTVDAAGNGLTRLTFDDPAFDGDLAWSPR